MSSIYQISQLQIKDDQLREELLMLEAELGALKTHLKSELRTTIAQKKKVERGSVDLDVFWGLDFKKDRLAEKKELDKLMKEYNYVDKKYRAAREQRRVPGVMDAFKSFFDE